MTKYVYDFTEGNRDLKDLLGGKGANLAEMTNLGLPGPARLHDHDRGLQGLPRQRRRAGRAARRGQRRTSPRSRRRWARSSASPTTRCWSRVRSGAKFSMPGMMETVLNIGLNDESVQGLAKQAGSERFAWDSYRRLIQMFGKTVLDIDGEHFEDALDAAKKARGTTERPRPRRRTTCAAGRHASRRSSASTPAASSRTDPREQMDLAVRAVFDSWNAAARDPLPPPGAHPGRPRHRGQHLSMVFGNLGMDSGTGVAFTRDPGSGQQGIYGDYLQNAQGEDVVAGIRNTLPLAGPRGHRQAGVRPAARRSWRRSRTTTATCATSSSPSSAASCGCCRPASASARRARPSGSRPSSSTRA